MRSREPTIKQKTNGAYFVHWGGKDHYLSVDLATAKELFKSPSSSHPGSLTAWRAWLLAGVNRPRSVPASRLKLIDAAEIMLGDYLRAGRTDAARYFQHHLSRWMTLHGEAELVEMTMPRPERGRYNAPAVAFLDAFKNDLRSVTTTRRVKRPDGRVITKRVALSNKTINHDVLAVQRLFNFCGARGLCPTISWKSLKKLPTRRGRPEVHTVEQIGELITAAGEKDPRVVPWLALNYLTVARPSEIPRLVAREGRFVAVRSPKGKIVAAHGLFELDKHKSSWRGEGDFERCMLITAEAAEWLAVARAFWIDPDAYAAAAVGAGFRGGPHILRDSAASHLRDRGVPLEDVRLALGHVQSGEWRSYAHIPWQELYQKVSRITLRSVLEPPSAWAKKHGTLMPKPRRLPKAD